MPQIVDVEEAKRIIKSLFDKTGADPSKLQKWYDRIDTFNKPIVSALCTHVATHIEQLKRLNDIIANSVQDYFGNYISSPKPIIILCPDNPAQLRVYPNLILDEGDVNRLSNISIFECDTVFKTFMPQYEADLAHPHRKVMWETKEAVAKKLGEYVDMDTARVLSRYVNWKTPMKDNQIRDMAIAIDDWRKPIAIKFTEKPEDFTEMYSSGPHSCMSVDNGKWGTLSKVGLCPASFYHYFPYTKGAYALKGRQVVCRTILFRYPDKMDKWYYGRLYSSSPEYSSKFIESLAQQGVTSLEKSASYTPHKLYSPPNGTAFEIPGIQRDGATYVMPWPYFDNMEYYGRGFYATFDTKTKNFTVTYNGKESSGMLPVNNQGGMLVSTDYVEQKCARCNAKLSGRGGRYNTHDGVLYCSVACMSSDGYVKMYNRDGGETWQKPNEHVAKTVDGDMLFTTVAAAQAHGYYPIIINGACPEEGSEIVVGKGREYHGVVGHVVRTEEREMICTTPLHQNPAVKVINWKEGDLVEYIEAVEDMPVPPIPSPAFNDGFDGFDIKSSLVTLRAGDYMEEEEAY